MFDRQQDKSGTKLGMAAVVALGVLEFASLTGCSHDEPKPQTRERYSLPATNLVSGPILKEPIKGIPEGLGHIYHYPGGVCVPVLHVDIELFPPDPKWVQSILQLDPDKPGEIVRDTDNPWSNPKMQGFFNCHAFALGEAVGFTPRDQVNGAPVRALDYPNSVGQLLPAFFQLKRSYTEDKVRADVIEADSELTSGDRIFFVSSSADDTEHPHSGRIIRRGNENWVMSKLGEDPLIISPVQTLFELYQFDRIEIWIPRSKN